jgi:hypothetical protein
MDGSRGSLVASRRRFIEIAPAIVGSLLVGPFVRKASAQSSTDWIEAVFPERSHDFGTVAKGSILRHSFRITNRSNREVHVTGWKPKCGCTGVTVGAQTIPPGAQTTIEAVFDTTKFSGFKASGLTLTIDRPALRSVDYELSCFIQDEVSVSPGVLDFDEVRRGSPADRTVTLRYLGGNAEWRVVEMRHENSALTAKLVEQPRTSAGELSYQLIARLDAKGLKNGNFRDQVTLVTNDPQRQTIPVSVAARVVSDVTLSPTVLNLGQLRPGQRIERTVLLKGPEPFRVLDAKAAEGQIATVGEASDASRPLHQVKVAIEAPNAAGSYHAILEIRTDRPDEPPARLTAFATVTP